MLVLLHCGMQMRLITRIRIVSSEKIVYCGGEEHATRHWLCHPLYLGLLLGFWCTPLTTLGHLLFAMGMSVYILIGVQFEERDLELFPGEDHRRYKQRVPMLLPSLGKPHETIKARSRQKESFAR